MNINKQKISAAVLAGFIIGLPFAAGAGGLVPCGDSAGLVGGVDVPAQPPCDFNFLIVMANSIIKFLLYGIAIPLTAIGFMVVGARLVLNTNKDTAWTQAKDSFEDIGIGFFIILGAYVLIKVVLFQFVTAEQATFMQSLFQ